MFNRKLAFLAFLLHSFSVSYCEDISCPVLFVTYADPPTGICSSVDLSYQTHCSFKCLAGYQLKGSEVRVCQLDKTWSGTPSTCKDYQPPTLTCPGPHLSCHTTKGKATGKVSWNIQVTDNSEIVDPNAKINVTSTHQSSQELPIGSTDVQVTASDSTGNTATCHFTVRIEDIEAPIVKQCPGDIVREVEYREVRLHWENPVFSDNSGSVTFSSNRQIGDLFAVPGVYEIVYTANDPSNNENKKCSFRITLKQKKCPLYPPPKNGALACVRYYGDDTCAVMCQTGTDFEFSVPVLYYCTAPQWSFYSPPRIPYNSTLPWANCTAGVNPSSSIMSWSQQYHYFDGDAHDPNVQASIKEKFYQLLTSSYVPPFFCRYDPACLQNIFVSPGIKGESKCTAGWAYYGSSCYYVKDTPTLKQTDARQHCQNLGGDLAIIKSEKQNDFIFSLIQGQNTFTKWGAWIGIQRKADGKFYWIDNTPVDGSYSIWAGGEPNNAGGSENCVQMYGQDSLRKTWNDFSCDLGSHVTDAPVILCQKPQV